MQRHKKLEFVPADDDSAHFEQAINVAKNTLKDRSPDDFTACRVTQQP